MRRLPFFMVAFAAVQTSIIPRSAAQDVKVAAAAGTGEVATVNLALSKDGKMMREIQRVTLSDTDRFWRVRTVTYAATGAITRELTLQPYTGFFSATTDGRIAIISVDTGHPEDRSYPFLLDTDTGRTQDIPRSWFDSDDQRPVAAISGDGRFVSIFSESGPNDSPLVVTVYDWRAKKLVASHMSEVFSAGGIFGGRVTEDGKIEFWNNRVGSKIVEPKTGRSIVEFGPNAVRSPDGRWIVELAGYLHGRERLDTTVMNGETGELLGKLDLKIRDQPAVSWSGVFCGTTGRFISWDADSVLVFDIPSRKQIATIPVEAWRDQDPATTAIGCSWNGKRVAIRSGQRLTLHDLK